jgi:SAM-dependent methyltransferase
MWTQDNYLLSIRGYGLMESIDVNKVRSFYEGLTEVWPEGDRWHLYSKKNIERHIFKQPYDTDAYILNAGSGGNAYGLTQRMHHVDIVDCMINSYPEYTVSSIEKLPFASGLFSDIICVGSVINYCDAIMAATELSRVLKRNGRLLLEFESSWGLEYIKNRKFKQSAAIVEVRYADKLSNQWIYSPKYIKQSLTLAGLRIVHAFRFHYLSSLHYGIHQNENAAAAYTRFDAICRNIPLLRQYSSNVIFTCVKL